MVVSVVCLCARELMTVSSRHRRNDPLKRKPARRKLRTLCLVSAEGSIEQDYFKMYPFLKCGKSICFVRNEHPSKRNPLAVLNRMKKDIEGRGFQKNDEAWIVVDVDNYCDEELSKLFEWAKKKKQYHVAISNPKFELFLVMHYERGNGCTTSSLVDKRLRNHFPDYDKHIKPGCYSVEQIQTAIKNAREKRASCTELIPRPGMTDAYKLAESLLPDKVEEK
jgi:hypothetical protein